ncbi:MAG: mitochondrial fission ELM1 family protein [Spirochaetaceae bacterium]|nr:mitochondrial fission ELM1 family protein [Myxococcales bacterium]MCB9725769.1 mitochondrial fission ELM1 family protein [Spirochaetaceae bacterium]
MPDPRHDGAALRAEMECVVLPVRPGVVPSGRPPVEIFLGTEPAQYRANRVFGWSIEKVRDPAREVRIHLMSELDGFDRRGWTTGFTNYRFAIPALMGFRGRAIYNDEDEIYLTDPGELFDLDLGGRGYLAISDTESSVMLIDCERMAPVWTLQEARHAWKRSLLRKATKAAGVRGDLDPHWNARDEEFEPGHSHLLHYTTLHTQPWRPFPERFVYQEGHYTQLWHDLEREAIARGFEFFTREQPSRGFARVVERLGELPVGEMGSGIGVSGELAAAVEAIVRRTKAASLLELAPDLRGDATQRPARFGLDVERRVGLLELLARGDDARSDVVVCVDGLEALPVWDVPWLIDSLFRAARRGVFVGVRCPESPPRRRLLLPPQGTVHTPDWWRSHFEVAAARHPGIAWELMTTRGKAFAPERIHVASGGPRHDATPPLVWTLTDGAPGNEAQVEALVRELGWPAESITPGPGAERRGRRGLLARLRGEPGDAHPEPEPQASWPDLLIVAGRAAAPAARRLRERSRGRTRVVALGAKASTPVEAVDLAVTPRGAMLFPHPDRMIVERPLVASAPVRAGGPRGVSPIWRERLAGIPGPRIALLIGSGTSMLGLDGASAEALGRLVRDSAAGLGASVVVSASRHASPEVLARCLRGLGRAALVHRDTPEQRPGERAWSAILESAEIFVMAGLGETAVAELCATGRPVFLAPQRAVARGPMRRVADALVDALVARANARPENDRGTTRPQQGLELLAARWIARGVVRPRRDVESLRGRLVRGGHARLLRAPIRAADLAGFAPPPVSEVGRVADRIRAMLGTQDAPFEDAPFEEGPGAPGPDRA